MMTAQRYAAQANWDSLVSVYSADSSFRFFESGALQYPSATAIREALRAVPRGTRIETRYDQTQIMPLAPRLAHVSTLFHTEFVGTAGSEFSFGGAVTMLWRHESVGWRILFGHSSAPVPRGS
ncbi:MAG: nuclear transport factor 2 family protein [Gemmatimonadaceae bacterium]